MQGIQLRRTVLVLAASLGSLLHAQNRAPAPTTPEAAQWREYAGDVRGTKYSPLSQIAPANISQLAVAWRWESADRGLQASNPLWSAGRNEDTPLMTNGTLYTVTGLGLVAALDPDTGRTRWVYDPESYKSGTPNNVGFIQRGLAYWSDGTRERVLLGTGDAYLISIDARTGKPDPAFGSAGKVDLITNVPGAVRAANFAARRPLIAGNVAIVGNSIADTIPNQQMPPGDVKAFDIRSGALLWTFHTVPRRGEFGYDTWLNEAAERNGSTNVWAGMSYDPDLDFVYLPTSSPDNNGYGGLRPGNNLFSDSIVCVEAKTGRRVWHYQVIHHDIWDYDLPAIPVLGDITVDGRRIPAVMQVSKQAFTYVLNRRTGEPVWPIEERAVPQSTLSGEQTSPTQPFPTKPPAYDLQGSAEENLVDFTPELRRRARAQHQQLASGPLYTPAGEKAGAMVPGVFGGTNWGGAGFDPEAGVLYVPSIMMPTPLRARLPDGHGNPVAAGPNVMELMTIEGLSIFKPPYARVTAIDMNKGTLVWSAPLGNGPRNHPLLKGLSLPPLGDGIHRASVLVTKTLLFVNVSRLANNGLPQPPAWVKWADPDADRTLMYVFDKATGKLLHDVKLDGMSAAAPMTYLHNGNQYIVVAVGGGRSSELVALRLPDAKPSSGR
jgi:quinoprotein glucose dehydrogenase